MLWTLCDTQRPNYAVKCIYVFFLYIDEDAATKKETPSKQQKAKRTSETSTSQQQREIASKTLPESVKALKKKYTEQRIVRTAISQKLDSKRENSGVKESGIKALRSAKQMVTRNAKPDSKSTSGSNNTSNAAVVSERAKKAVVVGKSIF